MSEQPKNKPRITLKPSVYTTECMDIEEPESAPGPRVDVSDELTLMVEFGGPLFAHPGDTLTLREPDGTMHTVECLSVKVGKGPDGEYIETCKIRPAKTTAPETPA